MTREGCNPPVDWVKKRDTLFEAQWPNRNPLELVSVPSCDYSNENARSVPDYCGQRNTLVGTVRSRPDCKSDGSGRKNVVLSVLPIRSSKRRRPISGFIAYARSIRHSRADAAGAVPMRLNPIE